MRWGDKKPFADRCPNFAPKTNPKRARLARARFDSADDGDRHKRGQRHDRDADAHEFPGGNGIASEYMIGDDIKTKSIRRLPTDGQASNDAHDDQERSVAEGRAELRRKWFAILTGAQSIISFTQEQAGRQTGEQNREAAKRP